MKKNFLFLQGVASPFFALLSDQLRERGHRIHKIHFCGGDLVYWWPRPARAFRGTLDALPDFLLQTIQQFEITDIVLFGDQRPIHQPVFSLAKSLDLRIHVFEEGYLRPHWLTLERNGVNAHSQLPKDPDWYREVVERVPLHGEGQSFLGKFRMRAIHDVIYHSGDILNPVGFRHYRHHAPLHPVREYLWYIRRYPKVRRRLRVDLEANRKFVGQDRPYFLLPLQLYSDSQITCHSEFCDTFDFIQQCLHSFAQYAPTGTHLVVKNHPLDPGILNYENFVKDLAHHLGIGDRVHYYDYGDLVMLLKQCQGVVTINSTVGTWALGLHKPVLTLANPVYNLPGLTSQQSLAAFWHEPSPPDPTLWSAFRQVLIHGTQINGGFYCATGMDIALPTAVQRLEMIHSPLEELLCRNDLRKPSSLPARPAPLAKPLSGNMPTLV
ncbi:MAG: capsular biosynthesis protein [Acidithiobacillus sp.]